MSTETITIPAETAAHVLWLFGQDGGYPPGSYSEALLSLISRSDVKNTARFAAGFPAETAAVSLAKNDEQGIAKLRAIATGGAS